MLGINAAERVSRNALLGGASAIVETAKRQGRLMTPLETAQLESFLSEAERLKLKAESTPAIQFGADLSRSEEPGASATRVVMALLASGTNTFDRAGAIQVAEKRHGERSPEVEAIAAADFSSGGALVRGDVIREVIEALRPRIAVARFAQIWPSTGETPAAARQNLGATVSYIGEGARVPSVEPTFQGMQFTEKTLAALVPVSNGLLRTSPVLAERAIRADLLAAVASRADQAFIRDAGTEYTPRGLRYLAKVTHVFASAGSTLANVRTDLKTALSKLLTANVRMIRPAWILSPRTWLALQFDIVDGGGTPVFAQEMNAFGTLAGVPFVFSSNVPITLGAGSESEIYLADFEDVVIAQAPQLLFAVNRTGAWDDNGTIKSALSLNQTILRVIAYHDINVRHEESVAVVTGVSY